MSPEVPNYQNEEVDTASLDNDIYQTENPEDLSRRRFLKVAGLLPLALAACADGGSPTQTPTIINPNALPNKVERSKPSPLTAFELTPVQEDYIKSLQKRSELTALPNSQYQLRNLLEAEIASYFYHQITSANLSTSEQKLGLGGVTFLTLQNNRWGLVDLIAWCYENGYGGLSKLSNDETSWLSQFNNTRGDPDKHIPNVAFLLSRDGIAVAQKLTENTNGPSAAQLALLMFDTTGYYLDLNKITQNKPKQFIPRQRLPQTDIPGDGDLFQKDQSLAQKIAGYFNRGLKYPIIKPEAVPVDRASGRNALRVYVEGAVGAIPILPSTLDLIDQKYPGKFTNISPLHPVYSGSYIYAGLLALGYDNKKDDEYNRKVLHTYLGITDPLAKPALANLVNEWFIIGSKYKEAFGD